MADVLKVERMRWAAVAATAACTAVAAALFLTGSPDSFELPKRLVWGVLAAALSILAIARRGERATVAPSTVAAAILAGYALVRTALAGAPFWRWAEPLVAWAMPLCLFLAASLIDWRDDDRRIVARVVVSVGVAESLLMICQRFGVDPLFGEATRSLEYAPARMIGTIGYQNQAAELLGVSLFCIPACGLLGKAVRASTAVVILSAMLLAASRGVIVAVAVAAIVFGIRFASVSKTGILKIAAIAAIFVAVLLAIPEMRNRAGDLTRPSRSVAVQSRILEGRVALSMAREAPLLGHGAGTYAYSYIDRLGAILPREKDHSILQSIVWAREAHNDPLQFLAEFGIAGLALLSVFLVLACRGNHFLLPALFLTVCSLFSFSWQTSMAAPLAGLLLGIGRCDNCLTTVPGRQIRVFALALNASLLLLAIILNVPNFDIEEAYWFESVGEKNPFLGGRMRFEAAKDALLLKNQDVAFRLAREAEPEFVSPDLISFLAQTYLRNGHAKKALACFERLERSGIKYDEALKYESEALEALGMRGDALAKEARRFDLFGNLFSDKELYRLCVLHLMAGDGVEAERISWHFRMRCKHGRDDGRWSPEWSNLRGGSLLALGRTEEAKAYFEDALRRKPELTSARKNLERCGL